MGQNQSSLDKRKSSIDVDGILYELTEKTKEACITGFISNNQNQIYIPRSIQVKKKEYLVTAIYRNTFHYASFQSIQFDPDSPLQLIAEEAFSYSMLESITIPSNVFIICEGAFTSCRQLKSVNFASNNQLQMIEKNSFSKSSIESISIPKRLTEISESTFYSCEQLKHVEFHPNSELQTIQKNAFRSSSIESIFVPFTVQRIGEFAFYSCKNLKKFDIPVNSHLYEIGKNAFSCSSIESISLPSNMRNLADGWCSGTFHLKEIKVVPIGDERVKFVDGNFLVGKSDPKNDLCDILHFARRDIEEAVIPYYVQRIAPSAFANCIRLKRVVFPEDSQISVIDKEAFYFSSIESIYIPKTVTKVCESAFSSCRKLKRVEIPKDFDLQRISNGAFEDCTNDIIRV
ncbi:hypothetical protein M9Y10_036822 [Tritrichomonas musculus]|uniref:Surface antigen BspA-like n=1 Tax=Tritrichomonas musculus TaxID=1915356 RepID=A0ABR2GTW3_9EUKA